MNSKYRLSPISGSPKEETLLAEKLETAHRWKYMSTAEDGKKPNVRDFISLHSPIKNNTNYCHHILYQYNYALEGL